MNMHSPIKVALIGVSGYADCYYRYLLELAAEGVVKVCAATIINPEEVPEKCERLRQEGCRIYSEYTEMLETEAGQIDLCCIPTGIGWHRAMTVAAIEAGMHVLVEKPAAATLKEVDAMMAASERYRRRVFVGFQNMYSDHIWNIKERLLSGQLGQLKRIRVCALWPRSTAYYRRTNWAGKLYSGEMTVFDSPINNAMAHFILLALFWGARNRDEGAAVQNLQCTPYRAQDIESFDTFCARATLPNKAELIINMSHSSETHKDAEIIIETTEGCYQWYDKTGSHLFYNKAPGDIERWPEFQNPRVVMLQNVCKELQGHNRHTCSLKLARSHTQFIEQVHKNHPIHDIPASAIHKVCQENDEYLQVEGLSERLTTAHNTGTIPETIISAVTTP